ncbi:MAG: NUDIX domain-containing protein [Rhabdochlamydiaceae bacterium]|nr:NUDIX domain-containing protein [Rhabdochlamydiaceae bacterium]
MASFLSVFAAKEAKRFKLKVGILVVLIEEEQVLLLRRFQTGIDDARYVVPMGGHDGQEPLTLGVIREAKEEVNIDLKQEDIEVCHVMHRFHPMPEGLSFEQIDVFFRVKSYEGVITNNEPDRCDELAFFPLNDLPKATAPFIRQALQCIQEGKSYSEFGFG